MSIQQAFICGLSRVVTIAVLPRLNMEELMFEFNRRIQDLDRKNSIKDRLVSILRDVMLEEYRLLERKPGFSSPDETTILVQDQETATMQENAMTAETSSPDASQQISGLDMVIRKESDNVTDSEMLMHTKELELELDQIQLSVSEQYEPCGTPGSPTLPSETLLAQMNTTADSYSGEKDVVMPIEDDTVGPFHDELNINTPTCSTQVLRTHNRLNTSWTEETLLASCHLSPDHGDIHIKSECHVSEDDQIGRISQSSNPDQTENYADDRARETGFINSGHEHKHCRQDSSEETPFPPCGPTPDKDFENISSLLPASDSQIDPKCYVCDVCGFKTSTAHRLSQHRKRHKEEKPFMCGECGYRACHKYRLVRHMRTHTDEKPFKCNHCNYKTSHKRYLVEHMKTHSDAKPYRCEICDYQTYKKSHFEKHMMCHAGVKPYKCEECDYRTAYNPDLTRHRRRHTGERPYSCQECDYKAKEKGKLNRHMRFKHP
ncbi:zinc finger protein 813-like [Branchiostoma floridae]|uniref:Zinc finger protein 813-like n=1 Tax=Branchiostoma floridae TaxID=7739 RepID=A0A9J7KJS6_BRAFL|nr:zinc finger protein 813-like [Branchiostoma floridae]